VTTPERNPVTAAFAAAVAHLVHDYDVVSVADRLLRDCVRLIGAEAAGLVVTTDGTGLELLASTSHTAEELELYQMQSLQGPCIETILTGHAQSMSTDERDPRWPVVAAAMRAQRWSTVQTAPLRWRGLTIGAINAFSQQLGPATDEQVDLLQAFADVATTAIVHANDDATARVVRQTIDALQGRAVIEQAKGVLAYQLGVDMPAAFSLLQRRSQAENQPITATAAAVLLSAQNGL
jgi:hypothetical protein